jgi:hypothetical protein
MAVPQFEVLCQAFFQESGEKKQKELQILRTALLPKGNSISVGDWVPPSVGAIYESPVCHRQLPRL